MPWKPQTLPSPVVASMGRRLEEHADAQIEYLNAENRCFARGLAYGDSCLSTRNVGFLRR